MKLAPGCAGSVPGGGSMTENAFFLYRSETDLQPDSDAARDLLATARRINGELGLTGFLHHEDGCFIQWLEGPAPALDMIGQRIDRDPRHRNITYLSRGLQEGRQFDRWAMGYSTRSGESILGWLADNAVPVRDSRAYAAAVLAFLLKRSAATT